MAARPLAAWAQKAPVVTGFLGSQAATPPPKDPQTVALNQRFLDYGLTQGRDFRDRIAALAQMHRLPLFSTSLLIVEAGGLVSYGASLDKMLRRTGYYVKKILDGADPADLPIEQPTGLELMINLETAKTLGIEIPATLLSRADRVIE